MGAPGRHNKTPTFTVPGGHKARTYDSQMKCALYTIGFTQKTAEEFFGLLQSAGIRKLVDARENRVGQLSGFAKFPDIAWFLDRLLGIEYVHEPLFAPTPEIRERYQATKDWNEYELSFRSLMAERGVPQVVDAADYQGSVALLCSEPAAEKCHRRLVAEMLLEYWTSEGHDVQVHHLGAPKPKRGRKRPKGRTR